VERIQKEVVVASWMYYSDIYRDTEKTTKYVLQTGYPVFHRRTVISRSSNTEKACDFPILWFFCQATMYGKKGPLSGAIVIIGIKAI
jgi:hypothetical protein